MGLLSLSPQQKLLFKMIIRAITINKTLVTTNFNTNCSTNITFLSLTSHVTQFNIYRMLQSQCVVVNLGKLRLRNWPFRWRSSVHNKYKYGSEWTCGYARAPKWNEMGVAHMIVGKCVVHRCDPHNGWEIFYTAS